ncbi:MAG: hypothetical protein K9K38_15970 [Rhodoferax sp.]|nr:hypothetical protein [Rhodoferax sp.]
MKTSHNRPWSQAEIAKQAFEMLAIGNVAARRAQAKNRAMGIANYYSIAGRIVSDADTGTQDSQMTRSLQSRLT